MLRALTIALLLGASAPALATAAQSFAAGRFAEATRLGRKENTEASLVIAARAAATEAAWLMPEKLDAKVQLDAALADLERVLEKNPANLDARFQRGLVQGYIAKLMKSPGDAKKARKDFEAVLAQRPDDALVLGAMGGWHGEAVATLGKFLAGTALGAREADALRYYDKAVAGTGGDPAVPVFYASTLLGLSPRNAPRAKALLERAVKAPAADGFDRLMQANGRKILAALNAGDVEEARAVARKLGPLGNAS